MPAFPTLQTENLVLRPFTAADAPDVQRLAGDRRVADTTALIPHPYGDGMAEDWIATHEASWESGNGLVLAITSRADGELVGAIGLNINAQQQSAELGYWIGVPYWRRGWCTEAARTLVACGFETLNLNRIAAHHFVRNAASGRILEKCGMRVEGTRREAFLKWGKFEDLRDLAILRSEWEKS